MYKIILTSNTLITFADKKLAKGMAYKLKPKNHVIVVSTLI